MTIDEDTVNKLKEIARREGRSFKDVVNQTLRAGLGPRQSHPRFQVVPHDCGAFRTGVDSQRLNQLYDELESADYVAEHDHDNS